MGVKIKQDPNLLILFMGLKTIVKNEHFRDRDASPHFCHRSEDYKQDRHIRDGYGMRHLILFMGKKTDQDRNIRNRDASLYSFHRSEEDRELGIGVHLPYSFHGIED
jgi:hypothetical protein